MFEGFVTAMRDGAEGVRLRVRIGGEGPPLLLLHGNPQTHAMWHRVAPVLARRFAVYCPDITGYGFSAKPPVSADHAAYAKRSMAADMVALMKSFGHDRFQVVSHDRGARVAHRMALDHADAVERLCTMDIVPTLHHFETADMRFAMGYYHWFFLAQPHPKPERMIERDVEDWFDLHTSREPTGRDFFHPDARADYLAALREPGTVVAICEDYRAAATIDLDHDRASRAAGDRLQCPVRVLWGKLGVVEQHFDVPALWAAQCRDVTASAVPCGHYIPEEAPDELLAEVLAFFKS